MAKIEHPKNSPWMTLDLPLFSRIGRALTHNGRNPIGEKKLETQFLPMGRNTTCNEKSALFCPLGLCIALEFWYILSVELTVLHHPLRLSEAVDRRAWQPTWQGMYSPPSYLSRAGELQLQIGSCLWDFPLCLVWALESEWLQITLTWNNKQKTKMVQKPLSSDVILGNFKSWNVSSFLGMCTCTCTDSFILYLFIHL